MKSGLHVLEKKRVRWGEGSSPSIHLQAGDGFVHMWKSSKACMPSEQDILRAKDARLPQSPSAWLLRLQLGGGSRAGPGASWTNWAEKHET